MNKKIYTLFQNHKRYVSLLSILVVCIMCNSCDSGSPPSVAETLSSENSDTQTVESDFTDKPLSNPTQQTSTATVYPTLTLSPTPEENSINQFTITPTDLPEVLPTSTSEPNPNGGVMVWVRQSGYIYLEQSNMFGFNNIDIRSSNGVDTNGPAYASYLGFSNFSDVFAYWVDANPSELWVSDLLYKEPKLIFSDNNNEYLIENDSFDPEAISLTWLPDDINLIVDFKDDQYTDLLYNAANDTIFKWDYQCNHVSISPKSGQLATWCSPKDQTTNYAVIEWDGKIWYNDDPPNQDLVSGEQNIGSQSAWSFDGEKFAFFDPSDDTGSLYVAQSDGSIELVIPGLAYWLLEDHIPQRLLPYSIKWATNGERLLIYAKGNNEHSCPLWNNIYLGKENIEVPCWQIIDIKNGEILWSLGDVLDQLMNFPLSEEILLSRVFHHAVMSPDGKLIAVAADVSALNQLFIIDIENNNILHSWEFSADNLRWNDNH